MSTIRVLNASNTHNKLDYIGDHEAKCGLGTRLALMVRLTPEWYGLGMRLGLGRLHDRLDSLLCYNYEVLTYRKEEEPAAEVTRKPCHGFIHFSTSLEVSLWWVPVLGCVVLDSQVAKNSGTEGRNRHQTQHHTCSHTQHNTYTS